MDQLSSQQSVVPSSLWDEEHPRSLINLMTENAANIMKATREKTPDIFDLDERTLFCHLDHDLGVPPTPTDNRLRINFWDEYDKSQGAGRKMIMGNIVNGVCQVGQLGKYFARPEKLAWILMRPTGYKQFVEETLNFASMRMRQILAVDPIHPVTRQVNTKLAELQAKIYLMMEMRVHGAVAQKIEQKNMNLNVTATAEEVGAMGMAKTESELEARIKELERRERKALNMPIAKVIDAAE